MEPYKDHSSTFVYRPPEGYCEPESVDAKISEELRSYFKRSQVVFLISPELVKEIEDRN